MRDVSGHARKLHLFHRARRQPPSFAKAGFDQPAPHQLRVSTPTRWSDPSPEGANTFQARVQHGKRAVPGRCAADRVEDRRRTAWKRLSLVASRRGWRPAS